MSALRANRRRLLVLTVLFAAATSSAVEGGETPPDYLGKTKGGEEILLSNSEGTVRIVTFWATWCSPCMKELPVLSAIQKAGAGRIQTIGVNLKEPKRQYLKAVNAFKDWGLVFTHDKRGTIARKFDVEGIPHMLIIDVDGRVVHKHVGYNEDALEGIVNEINALIIKNDLFLEKQIDQESD